MLKIWEVEFINGDTLSVFSDTKPVIQGAIKVAYSRWVPTTKGQW